MKYCITLGWLKILMICCSFISISHGQDFSFKLYGGAFYYQGDLAPKPIDLSFGPGRWTWGLSSGYGVSDFIELYIRFMHGNIAGDDALSEVNERRSRNLSFRSVLMEYGTGADFKLNHFWKGLDKHKLRLYVSAGVNFISFNPQAYYDHKWVFLQPLGTEGQTLPTSTIKPYKLNGWSRATGIIVEFDFTKKIALGIEINARKTWTDYLDDVSDNYPDIEAMLEAGNILGAKLSDRSGELSGNGTLNRSYGSPRGRPDKKDWYSFFGMYLKITPSGKKDLVPEIKIN